MRSYSIWFKICVHKIPLFLTASTPQLQLEGNKTPSLLWGLNFFFVIAVVYKWSWFMLRIKFGAEFMDLWYIGSYPANASRGMFALVDVGVGVAEWNAFLRCFSLTEMSETLRVKSWFLECNRVLFFLFQCEENVPLKAVSGVPKTS